MAEHVVHRTTDRWQNNLCWRKGHTDEQNRPIRGSSLRIECKECLKTFLIVPVNLALFFIYEYREIQVNMVNFYGKSLRYGCNYIYQSMPRMLSIWLDFGTSVSEMEKDRDRTRAKLEAMNDMKTNLDKMTRIIGKHVKFCIKHMHL
jgi:hypothetical protein